VIGYLAANSRKTSVTLAPFLKGLKEAGFIEGQSVRIEYRWAEGRFDRLPTLAADLVDRRVAVLFAVGGPFVTQPAKAATSRLFQPLVRKSQYNSAQEAATPAAHAQRAPAQ
jgi:putative tryptophan/tyrosine transport system substrate-binding protein